MLTLLLALLLGGDGSSYCALINNDPTRPEERRCIKAETLYAEQVIVTTPTGKERYLIVDSNTNTLVFEEML